MALQIKIKDYTIPQIIQIQKYYTFEKLYNIVVSKLNDIEYSDDYTDEYLEHLCLLKSDDNRKKLIKELVEKNIFEFSKIDEESFFEILRLYLNYYVICEDDKKCLNDNSCLIDHLIHILYWRPHKTYDIFEFYCNYLTTEYGIEFYPRENYLSNQSFIITVNY